MRVVRTRRRPRYLSTLASPPSYTHQKPLNSPQFQPFSTKQSPSQKPKPHLPSPHIAQAHGHRLYDSCLRPYLDFTCIGHPLGHAPPEIVAAVASQAATHAIQPSGQLPHGRSAIATHRVRELFKSDDVFLFDQRDAALHAAISLSRRVASQHTRNGPGVVFLRARDLSSSGERARIARFGDAWCGEGGFGEASWIRREVDAARGELVPFGHIGQLEAAIRGLDVCCVVVEPVQFDAGVVVAKEGYLKKVKAACDRYGVVLVVDERRSAGGGLGNLLACGGSAATHSDIVLLGGGVVGGLVQFSGMLTYYNCNLDSSLAQVVRSVGGDEVSSYTSGPVVCAAVEAGCRVLQSREMKAHRAAAEELGSQWRRGLQKKVQGVDAGIVHNVRGQGLITALNIDSTESDLASRVVTGMMENGILVGVEGNVVFMAPPLGVKKAELDNATSVLRRSVRKVAGVKSVRHRKKSKEGNFNGTGETKPTSHGQEAAL